ncbi:MAG TPA: hypothetical protein VHW26_01875, partial [Solirubrobacteraceae bacterium]|nr:hypothetical protein [Solirubrobacteraceae bacterium]
RGGGVELDPGLDRVSGPWREPRSIEEETDRWWRPSPEPDEYLSPPQGRLVSGIEPETSTRPVAPTDAQGIFARLAELDLRLDAVERDDERDDEVPGPAEVLIEAYESDASVEVRYAAADGTEVLRGTVDRIDGVRFKLAGPDPGSRRWRWLKGLVDVRVID